MNQLIARVARVNLEFCMHIGANDHLLVLHDDTVAPDVVDGFVAAALALDAEVTMLRYRPRRYVSMREFGRFAAASLELTERSSLGTVTGAYEVGLARRAHPLHRSLQDVSSSYNTNHCG